MRRRAEYAARVSALRDDLVRRVREVAPSAVANGDPVRRLPANAHLTFPGCEGDSACSAGVPQPSHVLLAMGCSDEDARSSLRFSLGHTSTQADVDALVEAIGPAVERAAEAGAVAGLGGR